jgi:hypothetical protein
VLGAFVDLEGEPEMGLEQGLDRVHERKLPMRRHDQRFRHEMTRAQMSHGLVLHGESVHHEILRELPLARVTVRQEDRG